MLISVRIGFRIKLIESEDPTIGLLICTLVSENQGLEKSRSISNHRKISGSANLDFSRV
jgi:hypothetical protein